MTSLSSPTSNRSGLAPVLHGVGVIVVAFWLVQGAIAPDGIAPVVVAIGFVSLAAWLLRAILPPGGVVRNLVLDALVVVMLVLGALAVEGTGALLITPAIIAVSAATAERRRPIAFGAILGLLGLAIITAGSLVADRPGSFLAGCAAGLALGFVVGYSRRQVMQAQDRERELLERSLDVEREQARSALLADRATIARDIHDVLAHSLGGLVIQLDAVEALLENGRVDEATRRVGAARVLAADGLGEARRAVATLRDPGREQPAESDSLALPDAVDRLLAAHESLGGSVEVTGRCDAAGVDVLGALDPSHRRVLAAVTREALSNARRHAPGEPVTVAFSSVTGGLLRVTVSNLVGPAVSPGGGHGVEGMRERFAALDDASRVTAALEGDTFVVEAVLVTADDESERV